LAAPARRAPASGAPATAPTSTGCGHRRRPSNPIQSDDPRADRKEKNRGNQFRTGVRQTEHRAKAPIFFNQETTNKTQSQRFRVPYPPTSGGPAGGLTCGDMVLPGEKHASGPCRPSMAGWRPGPRPILREQEEDEGGERRRRGEERCLCVFSPRILSFSFHGTVAMPFFRKISAKPCAAHDVPSRLGSQSLCPAAARVYKKGPDTQGQPQDTHRPTCRFLHCPAPFCISVFSFYQTTTSLPQISMWPCHVSLTHMGDK
jgi:hypothetical protein